MIESPSVQRFNEIRKVLQDFKPYKTIYGSHEMATDPGLDYINGQRRGSVTQKEGEILSALATNSRALEIGTGTGISSIYIAQSALSLLTIDPDPWVIDQIHPTLKSFSSKIQCAPKLPPVDDGSGVLDVYDFIFIDGNHDTPFVVQDITDAKARLAINGIIAIHDLQIPTVWEAIYDELNLSCHDFKTEQRLGLLLG